MPARQAVQLRRAGSGIDHGNTAPAPGRAATPRSASPHRPFHTRWTSRSRRGPCAGRAAAPAARRRWRPAGCRRVRSRRETALGRGRRGRGRGRGSLRHLVGPQTPPASGRWRPGLGRPLAARRQAWLRAGRAASFRPCRRDAMVKALPSPSGASAGARPYYAMSGHGLQMTLGSNTAPFGASAAAAAPRSTPSPGRTVLLVWPG